MKELPVTAPIVYQAGVHYPVDPSLPSSELVYGLINYDNGTNYTPTTLRLSTPQVNMDTIKYPRNSKIFAVSRPGAPTQGSTWYYYDRISLPYYLSNYPEIHVEVPPGGLTMRSLIPFFNETFNMGLEAQDVRDDLIDFTPNAVNRFTISTASLAWQDSVEIVVEAEKIDIGTLPGLSELDLIQVVDQHPKTYGELYGYWTNTKPIGPVLFDIPMTRLANDVLARALTSVTGDFWSHVSKASPFNLYNATVKYNGRIVDQTEWPGNADKGYMLVVNVDPVFCTEFQNPLVLYYNRVQGS